MSWSCRLVLVILPVVDYKRTSRRAPWTSLPLSVRRGVEQLAGARVSSADPPVGSGFSGAYAGRLTTVDGRRIFAKAGSPEQPHVVRALSREARVLAQLPAGMPAPRSIGSTDVDGWSVLVLEMVQGRMPGSPWTPSQVRGVHRACVTMAELGSPSPFDGDVADQLVSDPDLVAVAQLLAGQSEPLSRALPGWLGDRRVEVGELVLEARGKFDGDTICHGDLRPDNLLVDRGIATVLDWNFVGVAAPWLDWVGLLPLMAAQGVNTDTLIAESPLTRDADPKAVDAYLAAIAIFMMAGFEEPVPPGCTPALRQHQLLMAHVFLELLRRRRHWEE